MSWSGSRILPQSLVAAEVRLQREGLRTPGLACRGEREAAAVKVEEAGQARSRARGRGGNQGSRDPGVWGRLPSQGPEGRPGAPTQHLSPSAGAPPLLGELRQKGLPGTAWLKGPPWPLLSPGRALQVPWHRAPSTVRSPAWRPTVCGPAPTPTWRPTGCDRAPPFWSVGVQHCPGTP